MTVLADADTLYLGTSKIAAVYAGAVQAWPPPSAYDSAVLADVPVGFWPLSDKTGMTAVDKSENGFDGAYVGGVTLDQPGIGDGDGAPLFDAVSGYVQIPANPKLTIKYAQPLTLEAWMNWPLVNGYRMLMTQDSGNYPYPWEWRLGADYGWAQSLLPTNVADSAAPAAGEWTHMVVTVDASGAVVYYRNGVQTATGHGMLQYAVTSDLDIFLGARADFYGSGFWNGQLAKCAIYDHVLTPAQVQAHYTARPNTKMSSLVDNFDSGMLDPAVWATDGDVTVVNGQVVMNAPTDFGVLSSIDLYDLTSSSIAVELVSVDPVAGSVYAVAVTDITGGAYYAYWWVQNGEAQAWYNADTTATPDDVMAWAGPYDPVAYRYFRIRESGGVMFWEHSPDGRMWTTDYGKPDLFDVTALIAGIYAVPPTTGVVYDNVNFVP